jgi:hypothetical protein
MIPPRRLLVRKNPTRKQLQGFDPKVFLSTVAVGRILLHYCSKQAIFSQGDSADAVFFIQEGRVKLSVLSKQGKEATIALLGKDDFFGRGMHRLRSTAPTGNRYCRYGLLDLEDRKSQDAAHAPRGTRILRYVCWVRGRTSQSHTSGLGRSTVQFERKAVGTGTLNAPPASGKGTSLKP